MQLNHGLTLSSDGNTLYASSPESVFAWAYDAGAGAVKGDSQIVVTGMSNNDLTTRTLLMSKKQDGVLVVSRGSNGDFDVGALDISTGLSQIKAFDLSSQSSLPYDFDSEGRRLGWGLRNSVGVGEHPVTGGIYSLDNGIDSMTRDGTDIHESNPGEELNFHGFLNASTDDQGGNYGYPSCYAPLEHVHPRQPGLACGQPVQHEPEQHPQRQYLLRQLRGPPSHLPGPHVSPRHRLHQRWCHRLCDLPRKW